jgi:hypothetical protein
VLLHKASLDLGPPTYLSHVHGITDTPHLVCLLKWDLAHFLPGLALNHDLPNLHLPSSWDYRQWANTHAFPWHETIFSLQSVEDCLPTRPAGQATLLSPLPLLTHSHTGWPLLAWPHPSPPRLVVLCCAHCCLPTFTPQCKLTSGQVLLGCAAKGFSISLLTSKNWSISKLTGFLIGFTSLSSCWSLFNTFFLSQHRDSNNVHEKPWLLFTAEYPESRKTSSTWQVLKKLCRMHPSISEVADKGHFSVTWASQYIYEIQENQVRAKAGSERGYGNFLLWNPASALRYLPPQNCTIPLWLLPTPACLSLSRLCLCLTF